MPTENNDLPDSISAYLKRMSHDKDMYQAEAAAELLASACGKKSITSMLNRQISIDDVITILGVVIESAGHNYYAMRAGEEMVRRRCIKLAEAADELKNMVLCSPAFYAEEAGITSETLELLKTPNIRFGNDVLKFWDVYGLDRLQRLAKQAAEEEYQSKFPYFDARTRKENRLAAFVSAVDNEIAHRLNNSVRLSHGELAGLAWGAIKDFQDQSPIRQSYDSKDPRAESVRKIRPKKG